MENIIDVFYQKIVKPQEDVLAHALSSGKWNITMGIVSYILFTTILIFVTIFIQFTPDANQANIIILIVFVILTISHLLYIYRMYLQVSKNIPVKKRLLKKLQLRENGSIDNLYYAEAEFLYFITFIIALILLTATYINLYSFIISIIVISGVIILIYLITLTHKTKIKKESIIVGKFFTRQKLEIKWSEIQDARITKQNHIDKGGGYIAHHLYLKTTFADKPVKIHLGRNQEIAILEIIPAFIQYMKEVQGAPSVIE